MALEEFRTADQEKMGEAQAVIVRALLPMLEVGVHPLILVFALVRATRVILRKTSKDEQAQVVPVLFAYLSGRTSPPATGGSALWTPDKTN
jgi:hypothetical protein